MKTNFPPGHPQAIKSGCKCPANNGSGAYIDAQGNPVYWFNFECPLHGDAEQVASEITLLKKESEKNNKVDELP